MMRIAHVIPGLAVASGPTTFCVRLADELTKRECDVDLYVANLGDNVLRPQTSKVAIIEFGNHFRPHVVPDLIHVHALWAMPSHRGCVYARKNKIPYIISTHGMLAPWALKHKWLKKKIAWWVYQKADLEGASMFHVTAESEVTWLRGLGFKQPCVLAPLGSDLPDLDNAETQRRKDVKTVLFVGRIYPVKGLMNLVKAWAAVKKSSLVHYCDSSLVGKLDGDIGSTNELMNSRTNERPPWQLVLAGPDQAGHKAELEAEAKKLGLSVADIPANQLLSQPANPLSQPATPPSPPDLVFTGPVYGADKDALYRMADLFVLPSFTENFGVVVTDALSYGVPVITTKGTPWEELLGRGESVLSAIGELSTISRGNAIGERGEMANTSKLNALGQLNTLLPAANGRCGWWIDIGVEPLVEALKEAMGLSDEERRAMGANGRKLVEAKYTWPAITEQMKAAYDWILNGGKLPKCVRLNKGG